MINEQQWNNPKTTTVLLSSGAKIETEVNGLSMDGYSGSIFIKGQSIPVHINKDGMWEEEKGLRGLPEHPF